MKTIQIVTIQGSPVISVLNKKGVYYAETERYLTEQKSNLLGPYRYLMKEYGYKHWPIFACPVGYRAEYYGCNTTDAAMIQLEVPETEIKVQKYYEWVDLVFYMENPTEWQYAATYPLVQFYHDTLFAESLDTVGESPCQVTLERLESDWVVDCRHLTQSFLYCHDGSGGQNILQTIDKYLDPLMQR